MNCCICIQMLLIWIQINRKMIKLLHTVYTVLCSFGYQYRRYEGAPRAFGCIGSSSFIQMLVCVNSLKSPSIATSILSLVPTESENISRTLRGGLGVTIGGLVWCFMICLHNQQFSEVIRCQLCSSGRVNFSSKRKQAFYRPAGRNSRIEPDEYSTHTWIPMQHEEVVALVMKVLDDLHLVAA